MFGKKDLCFLDIDRLFSMQKLSNMPLHSLLRALNKFLFMTSARKESIFLLLPFDIEEDFLESTTSFCISTGHDISEVILLNEDDKLTFSE
mmetsp:Transcript_25221/g.29083  ORF Transcript_25221/g.29083 Transcript_25221/m.29083 type:complete len:91 (-) Transcript_25221:485-757(-)